MVGPKARPVDLRILALCISVQLKGNTRKFDKYLLLVEENYSESVTIVWRQRFEGGFHIRQKYSTKYAGVSPQKCGLNPPGGQIQNGRQQNNCLAFNDPK